jgi:hypothetical protein
MSECQFGQPTWTSREPHTLTAPSGQPKASLIAGALISVRAAGIGR